MSHKSYWSKVLLSAYKASHLFLDQPALKVLFWIGLSSFGFHQSWVHPFKAPNCPEWRSWQDIHHWELKVLVEPETRQCLDLSSAHVHTNQNLINLQQTCALVDYLCLPNGSICRRHIHTGLCAHILLSSTDLSSLIHLDIKSLISY